MNDLCTIPVSPTYRNFSLPRFASLAAHITRVLSTVTRFPIEEYWSLLITLLQSIAFTLKFQCVNYDLACGCRDHSLFSFEVHTYI